MFEVIGAFLRGESAQDVADRCAEGFNGSRAGGSQRMLEFGKQLLDRVQVGRILRQKNEMCAGVANGGSHGFASVAAEIVHNDDIARPERGEENRFDIEQKTLAIDGAIDEPGRIDAIVTERSQERHRVPVTVRCFRFEPFSYGAPAAQWRHVGLRPGLVDKDEPRRINARLIARPLRAPSLHVGTVLLFGQKCFF